MLGYWRDPELTRETLKDGWVYTRDMATVDEDGYIYIVDRKSDMIISGDSTSTHGSGECPPYAPGGLRGCGHRRSR